MTTLDISVLNGLSDGADKSSSVCSKIRYGIATYDDYSFLVDFGRELCPLDEISSRTDSPFRNLAERLLRAPCRTDQSFHSLGGRINSLYRLGKILRGARNDKFLDYVPLLEELFDRWVQLSAKARKILGYS